MTFGTVAFIAWLALVASIGSIIICIVIAHSIDKTNTKLTYLDSKTDSCDRRLDVHNGQRKKLDDRIQALEKGNRVTLSHRIRTECNLDHHMSERTRRNLIRIARELDE